LFGRAGGSRSYCGTNPIMNANAKIRVLYGDTDAMGQAYYGNYLKWYEVGRAEWFRCCGTSYKEVEGKGVFLPVVEAYCCYKKPAYYDDILTISTTFEFAGPARLRFNYEISHGDELLATGFTVHVCVNGERKVLRPPAYLKALLKSSDVQRRCEASEPPIAAACEPGVIESET
jgi:acyl-CoA thioester hydrolase